MSFLLYKYHNGQMSVLQ